MSILLNNVSCFQGASIFEPAEGGRRDSHSGALQLQRAVKCYGQLPWRAGARDLWRLWIKSRMFWVSSLRSLHYDLKLNVQIVLGLPSTVRLKLLVLLPAWLLATQL